MSDLRIQETSLVHEQIPSISDSIRPPSASIEVCRDGEWLPAGDLLDRIGAVAAGDGALSMDMSGLDGLETASLQLLIATHLEMGRQGRALEFHNVSDSLNRWFSLVGADTILNLS